MADATVTLNKVVDQLAKISASLERVVAGTNTYQQQAQKYQQDFQARREKPAADQQQAEDKRGFLKLLGDKIFGLSAPAALKSTEQQRYKNIAKCLNAVLHVDAISKSINDLRNYIEERNEQQDRKSLFQRVAPKLTQLQKPDDKKTSSVIGTAAKWGLIAAALKMLWDMLNSSLGPLSGLAQFITKWGTVGFVKYITQKISNLFNAITTPFKLIKNLITESLDSVLKFITKWSSEIFERSSRFIGGIVENSKNILFKKIAQWETELVAKFPKLAANLSSVGSMLTETYNSFASWVSKQYDSIAKLVSKNIGAVVDFVKQPFLNLSEKLSNIFTSKAVVAGSESVLSKLSGRFSLKMIGDIITGPLKIFSKLSLKALRFVPYIGSMISFYFAHDRYSKGDTTGAIIELVSGIIGLIPGGSLIAGALAMGLDAINVIRDLSGATAAETKTSGNSNWLTNIVTHLKDIIMGIPVVGNLIRSVQHALSGDFTQAISELIPGGIVDTIKNFKFELPSFGNVGSLLMETMKYLYDTILNMPVIGNLIRSLKHAASGNFKAAAMELLPSSVASWFDKEAKLPTTPQKVESPLTTKKVSTPQVENTNAQIATKITTPKAESTFSNELQKSMKDISKEEIDVMTEQRDLLRDMRQALNNSNLILQSLVDRGIISAPGISEAPSNIREERSYTRNHFLQSSSLFDPILK